MDKIPRTLYSIPCGMHSYDELYKVKLITCRTHHEQYAVYYIQNTVCHSPITHVRSIQYITCNLHYVTHTLYDEQYTVYNEQNTDHMQYTVCHVQHTVY